MRSPVLIKQINTLALGNDKTITFDRPGPRSRPRARESASVKLTGYPGAVRQLVVTGLGREIPTVIVANEQDSTTRTLIERYAPAAPTHPSYANRPLHRHRCSSIPDLRATGTVVRSVNACLADNRSPHLMRHLRQYTSATPAASTSRTRRNVR
jgi:hypothetical protein